tara:strand:- start:10815 stop:11111 length:297 start_codon:yes stop_codon:yes gene_type:complete
MLSSTHNGKKYYREQGTDNQGKSKHNFPLLYYFSGLLLLSPRVFFIFKSIDTKITVLLKPFNPKSISNSIICTFFLFTLGYPKQFILIIKKRLRMGHS